MRGTVLFLVLIFPSRIFCWDWQQHVPWDEFLATQYQKEPRYLPASGTGAADLPSVLSLSDIDAILTHGRALGATAAGPLQHGDDYKLMKRTFRDGVPWSETFNTTHIPLEIIHSLFNKKGYTLLING